LESKTAGTTERLCNVVFYAYNFEGQKLGSLLGIKYFKGILKAL